ncbi:Nucleotide-diphospho-sugar transferase [Trema orientale]|uniref:Nucleotide-diphospho-sugar transferase n=1 Tax=Trema orientale TaxID=63057 RepID=A0A2P5FZN9_TREOI|nr:Nucleotide-diphospho-sugar transferase [Trema orientale]
MSSSFYSTTATNRRKTPSAEDPFASGSIRPDIDPGPNPRPVLKLVAFGSIILLGFLQFLPATHFRYPSDHLRNWLPFHTESPSALTKYGASIEGNSSFETGNDEDDGKVRIVSWMDCLDLRLLAVLVNSTLSSSRLEEVKEIVTNAISEVDYSVFIFEKVAPFVIPNVHPFLKKFIYISPSVIMKGRVEELIGSDLSNYAVAAAENCERRLSNLVNTAVLDAIQRSVSKPWVSEAPYAKNACIPDLNLLLIDSMKLEGDFLQAVLWWRKVLNQSQRSSIEKPAFVLALYKRYLKLSDPWLVREAPSSKITNNSMVISYDGPKRYCSKTGTDKVLEADHGNIWRGYLPLLADQILGD